MLLRTGCCTDLHFPVHEWRSCYFKIGPLKFLTGTVWKPGNNIFGILPMIVGSICVTGLAILMVVPVAILTSVFLSRYWSEKVLRHLQIRY